MSRRLKRFDMELYKRRPDQMLVRLNEIVDETNARAQRSEQYKDETNDVLITGMQPDGTWGIKHWKKNGDLWEWVATVYEA